jgi:hypothetical protein
VPVTRPGDEPIQGVALPPAAAQVHATKLHGYGAVVDSVNVTVDE